MKIIRFKDGSYGIGRGFLYREYYGGDGTWWTASEYIDKYCRFSKEEATVKFIELTVKKDRVDLLYDKLTDLEKEFKRRADGNMDDIDALYKYLGVHGVIDKTGCISVIKNIENCSKPKQAKKVA